jgi:hypothetical protein
MPLALQVQGKSNPMTVITPVRPVWRWLQSLVASIFKLLRMKEVHDLAFIHFARWITIKRHALPRLSATQPVENQKDDLYLFTTNFNGPWDQYIDAFGMVGQVRMGLDWLWRTSRGFPGAWPMRLFKRYIRYYEYPLDHYYNAYPGASVRDIRAALELERELLSFALANDKPVEDAEFRRRFNAFVDAVAPQLGSVGAEKQEVPSTHAQHPQELHT